MQLHANHSRRSLTLGVIAVWLLGASCEASGQTTQPADADETVAATQPDEVRRGIRMGDPPSVRYRRYWENQARQVEPQLQGDLSRLRLYARFFERENIRDTRLFAWKVKVEPAGPGLERTEISGLAEFPEQAEALAAFLETLGVGPVSNQTEAAPTARVGDAPLAVVQSPRTFLRASLDPKAETVNEALAGEPLFLLDRSGDGAAYLVHAADGYVGWVRSDDLRIVSGKEFTAVINARPPASDRIDLVIAQASTHLGKPYIWGGRSDEGLDCSGLVQRSFAAAGVHLPRDAEQQALAGRLVAIRWQRAALRRGDILYFLGRRGFIAHTAIYLGDDKLIESADGGVRISEFRPGSRLWDTFCFGKRVLE